MILARLSKAVREQNWLAAGVEFVIVILGVVIGFQVTAWNAERNDHQSARLYHQRLVEDFSSEVASLQARAAYYERVREHANAALSAWNEHPEALGEAFLIDAYQATQNWGYYASRGVYDELLATGALNLIPDTSVRTRLASYYRSIDGRTDILVTSMPYRDLLRAWMPYDIQAAIMSTCGDVVSIEDDGHVSNIEFAETCVLSVPVDEVHRAVDATLSIPNFEQELTRQLTNLETKVALLTVSVERAAIMLEYLERNQP